MTTPTDDPWQDDDFLPLDSPENDTPQKQDDDDDDDDMELSSDDVSSTESNLRLPPWETQYPNNVHPLTRLHNEIVSFCHLIEPRPDEILQRQALVEDLRVLVKNTIGPKAKLKVFGSQATGLFLPSSDVDVVLLSSKDEDENNDKDDGHNLETQQDPLVRMERALKTHWKERLTYLQAIPNTKVPLVKFTTKENISVDISFDSDNAVQAAQLMKTYMNALPPLRPLTFVLKAFLAQRALNEPYSGGIGSYLLQLMVIHYLQQSQREEGTRRPLCLGSMLLEFLCLYGLDMNTFLAGVSIRHDGFFFPKTGEPPFSNPERPHLLAVENPLDPTADVGAASFRFNMVQRSFAVAYQQLLAHVSTPVEPTDSILASILPPTKEMYRRMK